MNNYIFTNEITKKEYKRINKTAARAAYAAGKTVILCACNLRPFGPWHPETNINRARHDDYLTDEISVNNMFNNLVNSFEYYNCSNNETGKYTAFYIEL